MFFPPFLKSGKENIRFADEPDTNELSLSYAGIIRIRFHGVGDQLLHLSRENPAPISIVSLL